METVGVGIYVTAQTDNSGWTGLVAAAGFVPGAVLGPVGGALADRFPRKALLLTTMTVQTVLATLLAFLAATGHPSPAVVTLIVFAEGCAQAIGFPTYQSVLPDLVPREDLVGAVALSSAQWNLGRVVGSGARRAGHHRRRVRVGVRDQRVELPVRDRGGDAAAPAAAAVRRCHHPRAIGQGVSYVRRDPGLRVVMGYMFVNTFLAAPFIALGPGDGADRPRRGHGRHRGARHRAGHRRGHDGPDARHRDRASGQSPRPARGPVVAATRPRGLRPDADARVGGDRALLRGPHLPGRAVELHVDRPAPGAGRDPRPGGEPARGRARRAVPARRRAAGCRRQRGRPPGDHDRCRGAHARLPRRDAPAQSELRRRARPAPGPDRRRRPMPTSAPPIDARRDGCEDVDTDRLGLAPDEIPVRSADS